MIDVGRVGVTSDHPSNLCPAKLVVFNTRAGGLLIRSHEFPDSVVSRSTNFLNDIVLDYVDLDHATGVRYAYISDTKGKYDTVLDYVHHVTSCRYSWILKVGNYFQSQTAANQVYLIIKR